MEQPTLTFKHQKDWEEWLSKNCSISNGVWLLFYKKDSGLQTFTYAQALQEALCYGWIDGQRNGNDEKSFIQRFTPRRRGSLWSKRNTEYVAELIKQNRMKPSGLLEVEKAKLNGRWENSYASPANMVESQEFIDELSKNKKAQENYEKLNKTNKYAILWQIHNAKKEETRVRRIQKFVQMLEEGGRLY